MATAPQIKFIKGLLESRVVPSTIHIPADLEGYPGWEASNLIDALKVLPWKPKAAAPKADTTRPGYFMVQGVPHFLTVSQTTGRPYVKRLSLVDGKPTWEFVKGMVYRLTEAQRMTLEQAKEYGNLTGHCAICGRALSVRESMDRGIGPVCAAKLNIA